MKRCMWYLGVFSTFFHKTSMINLASQNYEEDNQPSVNLMAIMQSREM